jgi:meiosis-specific protein
MLPGHLTSSSEDNPSCSFSDVDTPACNKLRRNVSAFKIMTVTRGFTEEADRLLNYLVTRFNVPDVLLFSNLSI